MNTKSNKGQINNENLVIQVNILNVEDQHMEHLRALRRDHSRYLQWL